MKKKINYETLEEIVVKSQEELDNIPETFKGIIYIEFGTYLDKAVVSKSYYRSVVALGNSSVVAWENSSVVAWENSSVVGNGNAQIVDRLCGGKIKISGNSRIVYMPKTIQEFMDFYGIKHTKTKAKFYKAVRKHNGKYVSSWDMNFEYEIGKIKTEDCDTNVKNECSSGIHIAHLDWALKFGSDFEDLAILEVETQIKDIVMPENTDGKVRTSKIKVIREVPLEECGVYGKILARRKKND